MGNCINFMSHPPHEKIKVVIRKGGQHKFKASTPVQAIASSPHTGYKLAQPDMPLAPNTKPDLAILLAKYLVPSKLVRQEGCKRKKIKIAVTREELELLLKSVNKRWSKRKWCSIVREVWVRASKMAALFGHHSRGAPFLNDTILGFYLPSGVMVFVLFKE